MAASVAPNASPLLLFVNGQRIEEHSVDPRMTLAYYLRNKLHLTGTKIGCNEGGCGACVVMVSRAEEGGSVAHASVNACLAPLASLHRTAVTTVEGIGGHEGRLHPVQERLYRLHGSQCGFCTPGFVMAMYALLRRRNGRVSVPDVDEALQGNLCRCTGYRPILEAFHGFARETTAAPPSTNTTAALGTSASGGACCGGPRNGRCCQDLQDSTARESGRREGDELLNDTVPLLPAYDPTQEPIFPPELLLLSKEKKEEDVAWERHGFRWHRPSGLKALLDLRRAMPEAPLVAGNTEIGVEVKMKGAEYRDVISLAGVSELRQFRLQEDSVYIGAGLELNSVADRLREARGRLKAHRTAVLDGTLHLLYWFAGRHIRNVATIGGNIATASPVSDLNPVWLAAAAKLHVASTQGTRVLFVHPAFFTGYRRTALEAGEVILAVEVPLSSPLERFGTFKQAQRREDDIAILNAALFLRLTPEMDRVETARLAFGGMAATPILALKTARKMAGMPLSGLSLEVLGGTLVSELELPAGSPGGLERYRLTLALSFLHKFLGQVREELAPPMQPSTSLTNGFASHEPEGEGSERLETTSTGASTSEPSAGPSEGNSGRRMLGTQIYPAKAGEGPFGRPVAHAAGWKHAKGAAYVHDLRADHALFAYPVLSPRSCGQIESVDTSEALGTEGVVGYVDWRDLPGRKGQCLLSSAAFYNPLDDWEEGGDVTFPPSGKVEFFGQMVGLIVAEDEEEAKRAAMRIRLTFRQGGDKPVVTIQDAITRNSFIGSPWAFSDSRDADNVPQRLDLSDPGLTVVSSELSIGGQDHFYLETHACLVFPAKDGEEDEMEVIASTQNPTGVQTDVAKALGLRYNQVTVRTRRLGGGFGGKEAHQAVVVATALAAHKLRRPGEPAQGDGADAAAGRWLRREGGAPGRRRRHRPRRPQAQEAR